MSPGLLDLEPKLSGLKDGATVSLLAEVIVKCPWHTVCRSAVHQQSFVTSLEIPSGVNTFAILDGQVLTGGRLPWIRSTNESQLLLHQGFDMSNFNRVIEICAGIGIVSTGLPFCQANPSCYVDQNERFVKWLNRKSEVPALQGDISDASTIKAVSDITEGCPMPISGGISCQPFSSLGDRRNQRTLEVRVCRLCCAWGFS